MASIKYFSLTNSIYWLALFYCLIKGRLSCSTLVNGETIEIEFNDQQQRKITLTGMCNKSWAGEEYYAFRGIPYAKPPVQELRFKDPQPLDELPSYIDARYDGHDCPSIYATNASEDCLTLNIYTPTNIEAAKLPVLLFIHPGGLYIGSSLSTFISPAYLLAKPVVLVTFNYRLGTLGFLQLGTRDIPGNAGFKDQVQAMRWVQKYIQHFGGNPEDVTLMGYSAGALSVQLHLVSPMSRGLFHKAIIMSGSLPPQAILPHHTQLELLRKQARVLNCTEVAVEAQLLNCFRKFNGNEIAATLRGLFAFGKDNPIYIYLPVIEADFGQERFLTENPFESLQSGEFAKVPILIGFTSGEFCQSAVDIFRDSKLERSFYEDFQTLAPEIFMYAGYNGSLSEISESLRQHYLPNFAGLDRTNLAHLCDLFSDAIIRFGAQRLTELAAPHTKIFPYSFEFSSEFSNLDYPLRPARVEHMDDLMYLFEMNASNFKRNDSSTASMIRQYTKFIYEFVIAGSSLFGKLPTYPTGYTKIGRSLEFQPGYNFAKDIYEKWKRLFHLDNNNK
ncbi:juvenile hormone esterase [Bactrocera dorsalis]|uniref:Carboxylic ester hydrolase n=1 Tax=Bactrocera dorsalis TaxID=27457 RepID=A0ABM3J4W4_BACDO|nr:juvenile hormone esterase [Bactrocera dorsalis]